MGESAAHSADVALRTQTPNSTPTHGIHITFTQCDHAIALLTVALDVISWSSENSGEYAREAVATVGPTP